MKTQTGLTIETKGNRINVYTQEEIERGKIVVDKRDTLITSTVIGATMFLVAVFYLSVFGLI